jgi:hypothetical protein
MYLAILACAVLSLCAGDPYVPGNPGAPWTQDEILITKTKFFHWFAYTDSAPKHLRLGFHDCIKYADGTGGCDGCLNWKGMDVKLAIAAHARNLSVEDGGGNNGLGDTVRSLEQIYLEANFPHGAPALSASPMELGWSRADLWAFSSMIAVEFGVMVNNLKCEEIDNTNDPNHPFFWTMRGCAHHQGDPGCKVNIERPFQFHTGRSDCTEHDAEFPYKATKEEKHPSAQDAGRKTIEYFQTEFPDLTGRDIVALMGAHTMGQPHIHISQIPYQWTSKGGRMFNNDYYRNIVGEDRWFFKAEPHNQCEKIGNAFGEKPKAQWLAHTRMTSENGGPVFWIHRNHVCPACQLEEALEGMPLALMDWEKDCCHNKPEGTFCRPDRESADMEDDDLNTGCERMRFISGADEIAINAEMGLYKQFEVDDDGVIYGCRGLEIFNTTMRGTKARTVWSVPPGEWGPYEPECEKQTIQHPAGSGEPLYSIFEEFASNQQNFVRDFVIALEKMSANGYPEGLTLAPDHWTDVSCPLPTDRDTPFACYKAEAAGSGEPIIIQTNWEHAEGFVIQQDPETGNPFMGTADMAAGPTPHQQWVWSESGTQLINLGTGTPLVLSGYSTWTIESFEDWQGEHTQIRSAYDNTKGLDAWRAKANQNKVVCENAGRGYTQRWNIITNTGQWESGPCVEEAVAFGDSFQIKNVKDKKVLQVADDGSVRMSKKGDQMWQWATNACNTDLVYLSSFSTGAVLAADGKTVTDSLEGNTWTYNAEEETLSSDRGYISGTKRKGQRMNGNLRRNKRGEPWKFFQWNLA